MHERWRCGERRLGQSTLNARGISVIDFKPTSFVYLSSPTASTCFTLSKLSRDRSLSAYNMQERRDFIDPSQPHSHPPGISLCPVYRSPLNVVYLNSDGWQLMSQMSTRCSSDIPCFRSAVHNSPHERSMVAESRPNHCLCA